MYQKYYKNSRGLILMDILLALSLSALFVVVMVESSANAERLLSGGKQKSAWLDLYEIGSSSVSTVIQPYGNERSEKISKSGGVVFWDKRSWWKNLVTFGNKEIN